MSRQNSHYGLIANSDHVGASTPGERKGPLEFGNNIDEMIMKALKAHPAVKAAQAQVRGTKEKKAAAEATGLPTLSLAASATRDQTASDENLSGTYSPRTMSVGLALNIPISSGVQRSYGINRPLPDLSSVAN